MEKTGNKIFDMENTKLDMYIRYSTVNMLKEFALLPSKIKLVEPDREILEALEDILLGSGNPLYNDSKEFKGFDYLSKLHNSQYLKQYQKALKKQQKYNIEITMLETLKEVYHFVSKQSSDLMNMAKKLEILNEYIRLARFKSDNQVWDSGYYITKNDLAKIPNTNELFDLDKDDNYTFKITKEKDREEYDIGVINSPFINEACDTHFTEEEKKNIYLSINNIDINNQKILTK